MQGYQRTRANDAYRPLTGEARDARRSHRKGDLGLAVSNPNPGRANDQKTADARQGKRGERRQ
jgi:hypothetical protein